MKIQSILFCIINLIPMAFVRGQIQRVDSIPYRLYPSIIDFRPNLPSPCVFDNKEYVVAVTRENKYGIIDVTLSNERGICKQLIIDTLDFPELVKYGLHDQSKLLNKMEITGWPVDTISLLGQPGCLSNGGFMAEGEDIISVIASDDQVVEDLDLTHPQMAKPLFHVLNMMDHDLILNRWNMATHEWENIQYFFYNDQKVQVRAYDTKGGQKSIFNDGLEGAFHVKLWRELSDEENEFLHKNYAHLSGEEFKSFVDLLSFINIGEMQPQYIMRYGFYEGHTFWRADPIAVSFIFGLKCIEELEEIFDHQLLQKLTTRSVHLY